jgi:hypothetical protein
MTPRIYVDICLSNQLGGNVSARAAGASLLMRSLHLCFTQMPGKFALALPDIQSSSPLKRLGRFRVFSENQDHLNALIAQLKQGGNFGRVFEAHYPEQVPNDFSGPWLAYRRLRIKSRRVPQCRAKTIRRCMEEGKTWVDMSSKENGQRFRMYLDVVPGIQADEPMATNSYGLSVASSPLYLPHIT